MAIEIIYSPLQIDQIAGDERTQIFLESDIIVPEEKRDIGRVLDIDAIISVKSQEVIQDRVMVEGTIRYSILYITEDDKSQIASMETDKSFTEYIEMPGMQPKMVARLAMGLEHVDFDIINTRKLNLRPVINVQVKVFDVAEIDIVDSFAEEGNIQILKETVALSHESDRGEAQTVIREGIELSDNMPTIVEILRQDIEISNIESNTSDNRVVVNGTMDIGFLYRCEDPDYPIHYYTETIDFAHVVDVVGAYQNMDCRCEVFVEDLYLAPKQDLNGDLRLVDIETLMTIEVVIVERQYKELLLDAYLPDRDLDIESKSITVEEPRGEKQFQIELDSRIELPENMPRCDNILYLVARPNITDERIYEDRVEIEGVISVNILYRSKEAEVRIVNFREYMPFSEKIPLDNINIHMDCESDVKIESTSSNIKNPNEIDLKIVLNVETKVVEKMDIDVIIGLEEKELPSGQRSGIYVYFAKPEDNLWSIAKRYNTTMEHIARSNTLSEDGDIEAGSRIIVYKRYDYEKETV
ncbi:MAG: DUF3794 domain-containing protein [Clostridiales bacterium]|nr:DUF3794 domain-containing protein [Clostridiales bacterium]